LYRENLLNYVEIFEVWLKPGNKRYTIRVSRKRVYSLNTTFLSYEEEEEEEVACV
jgi:hypothetical protein